MERKRISGSVSIPNRIYRISKAYLNQVRQRIDDELAERELDAGLTTPDEGSSMGARDSGLGEDPAVSAAEEMMRRAEERIAAARREMESRGEIPPSRAGEPGAVGSAMPAATSTISSVPLPPTAASSAPPSDPNAADYRVLGIPAGSDLGSVQSAYEKLARRLDPSRFTEDPAAQKEAERILGRVNAAYEALRNRLDPTQNRFGKLELE